MNKINKRAFKVTIILETLFFMVPTTILLTFGMAILILGFSQGNKDALTPAYLYFSGLLLIPGYTVYSLWWLVLSYHKLILSTIPLRIWFGLFIGATLTLFIVSPISMESLAESIISIKHFRKYLIFGLGPLIVVATLLTIIYLQTIFNKPRVSGNKNTSSL